MSNRTRKRESFINQSKSCILPIAANPTTMKFSIVSCLVLSQGSSRGGQEVHGANDCSALHEPARQHASVRGSRELTARHLRLAHPARRPLQQSATHTHDGCGGGT